MANPQKENGYTAIANEILEHIAKITLSPTGYKIIFIIWRQTYGYNRCQYGLSDTFIAKAINTTPALINREINRLIDRKILTLYKKGTFTTPRQIGFNKNYDIWNKGTIQTEGTIHSDTTIHSDDKGTIQTDEKVLSKQIVKERHSKESNKEIVPLPGKTESDNKTPYQQIVNLYHSKCISYAKIRTVSAERKKHMSARYKQYDFKLEVFDELFTKAEESNFLKGKDGKWKADFDWFMNENNMAKVLEGKYQKEVQNGGSSTIRRSGTKPVYREEDRENEDAWRSKRTPTTV